MALILAGDLGGSKTRLRLYDDHHGPIVSALYATKQYRSFELVLADFRKKHPGQLRAACFGAAGPVIKGTVKLTNNKWFIDVRKISRMLKCPVALLNDVEAAAYGLSHLLPKDVVVLSKAPLVHEGTRAIISPGTGLGESILYWAGHYDALPSEGGHADFAPRNALQWELRRFLQATSGDMSAERVLSGKGLLVIYDFLKHIQFAQQNERVRAAIREFGPPAITESAFKLHDPLCIGTVDLFVDLLAAETQRLALTAKALGGIYVAGGIIPHILPALRGSRFMRIFLDNRMKPLLEKVPVSVVVNEDLPLHGAMVFARTRVH